MAENLNFEADGSKCYDNKPENCAKYGRLYDWKTAMKACPSGWHLPDNEEWDKLYCFADGNKSSKSYYTSETAGKFLKATSGWSDRGDGISGNGEDKFGFAALPNIASWWTATEIGTNDAQYRSVNNYGGADWSNDDKASLRNIRCIKGENVEASETNESDNNLCDGKEFNPKTHFCYEYNRIDLDNDFAILEKCNGNEYDAATVFCEYGSLKKYECNGMEYDRARQFCFKAELYNTCAGEDYNPETHHCYCDGGCEVRKK